MTDHQKWDGVTLGRSLDDRAARARHDLADRAKSYDWSGVIALLTDHPEMANLSRPDGRSRYAPLHQAAHGGAPVEVVERLVGLGAWRLLSTADGDLPVGTAARGHRARRPPHGGGLRLGTGRVERDPGISSGRVRRRCGRCRSFGS